MQPRAPRCLFTVADTFLMHGRGLVLAPGVVPLNDERFRPGDPLRLVRPDGSTLHTTIGSLELPTPNPKHELFVLLKDLGKEDVPIGTEVWSSDSPAASQSQSTKRPKE